MDLQLNLRLKKFDPKSMKFEKNSCDTAPLVVVFGKKETGKTHLIHNLIYHQSSISVGNVFCNHKHEKVFYEKFVPPECIHKEYKSDIVEKFISQQKEVILQKKENDDRSFFVFDNCFYNNMWCQDESMQYIFMNGRHLKMLRIFSFSYQVSIPPKLRFNTDYVFILREFFIDNRQWIWENYAGMFSTFESFCSIMDQTTDNYNCLVIVLTARSNKIEDNIFWYKAD